MTGPGQDAKAESRTRETGVRFLFVSAAAFLVDLCLVLALSSVFALSLWVAAAISFGVVGAAFYFVHEHWTFARPGARPSARRLGQTIVSTGAAFGVRVGVIAALEAIRAPDTVLAAIYVGAGAAASLFVNYMLSRFWVFRP